MKQIRNSLWLFLQTHGLPLGVLCLPILVFHGSILFQGHVICGGDFINQFVPWRKFALAEIGQGRFPWWNPYTFSGTPLFANIQTSLLYPFNVMHALLPVERMFSFSLVFHHLASGLAMYCFLYCLVRNPVGALLGATVYAWSGFLIAHAHDGHLIHVRAYAWIPMVLYFQTLWRKRMAWWNVALFALFFTLMFYGGHTQIPLYIFYLVFARAVWWAWLDFRSGKSWKQMLRFPAVTMAGLALAILVSLPVLVPLYQLSKHTAGRAGGADYSFAVSDSMPPAQTLTLAAPFFYGHPVPGEKESRFWITSTGYHEICGYTGVLSLLLLFFGFLPRRADHDDGAECHRYEFVFFFGTAVFGLLFALGQYNPLYPLLYYGLPGWSFFRVPGRLLLLWIIGLSVCSAFGWKRWMDTEWKCIVESNALKPAAVVSALSAVGVLILWLSKPALLSWLREYEVQRTLVLFHLPPTSRMAVSVQLPRILFETRYAWMFGSSLLALGLLLGSWLALGWMKAVRFRWAWLLPVVILLLDFGYFSHRFIETKTAWNWKHEYFPQNDLIRFLQDHAKGYRVLELDDAIGAPGLESHPELRPNRLMYYGIESARGYDPIILKSYARLVNRIYGRPEDQPQGGLLFFDQPHGEAIDALRKMNIRYVITTLSLQSPFVEVWSETGSPMKVFELPGAKSRFFFEKEENGNTIEEEKGSPSEIELHVSCANDNRLIWSQNNYPGWQAFRDDQAQPIAIEPYMGTLISVPLSAGEHHVRLRFRPAWLP